MNPFLLIIQLNVLYRLTLESLIVKALTIPTKLQTKYCIYHFKASHTNVYLQVKVKLYNVGLKSSQKVARMLINKAGLPSGTRLFNPNVTMASTTGRWSGGRSPLRWFKTLKCRRQRKESWVNVASDSNVATSKI